MNLSNSDSGEPVLSGFVFNSSELRDAIHNDPPRIKRFSSLDGRLDQSFLSERLKGAKSYKRIAGYFRSSIFELVGEEIEGIDEVRVVCNAELDRLDIVTSKASRERELKGIWSSISPEVEALLHREKYRRLFDLLSSGHVQIKVVPRDLLFVHGKAGVIEYPDGSKSSFLGSVNESKSAFASNYEIIWEDNSTEAAKWVEAEFDRLWSMAYDLPDAIVTDIKRIANRISVTFSDLKDDEVAAASMVESPIYRSGEGLQPWQQSFVSTFVKHREIFGKARLLLADEVGLGKTLSMGTAALVSCLLGDGPVLILCPATLTQQWQTELKDHLGISSARWISSTKQWVDNSTRVIRDGGSDEVGRCPFQIGIVSTGLITQNSREAEILKGRRFGTVILDEAHKARSKRSFGKESGRSNLGSFMVDIAKRAKNVILGTATPIQTDVSELWDLMEILSTDVDFVLGRSEVSNWMSVKKVLPIITGKSVVGNTDEVWDLLRSPLPPGDLLLPSDRFFFDAIRSDLEIGENQFFTSKPISELNFLTRSDIESKASDSDFFRANNPFVRHVIFRRRRTLEEGGLLTPVGVNIHPEPNAQPGTYRTLFSGLGLVTNYSFEQVYTAAEDFSNSLRSRGKGASLFRAIFLQRICSSFASGLKTVERIIEGQISDDDEGEIEEFDNEAKGLLKELTESEMAHLERIRIELNRPEAFDPKLAAVTDFLEFHQTEGKCWKDWGCIVFSQYFDTVDWIAKVLATKFAGEIVAVYAGASKSGLYRNGEFAATSREQIKGMVKSREVTLVVATDAACEGLNLQTLGTLINIDLPWNPSRLEQRLGRIKRFGQRRNDVDMLNLVYQNTQDEKVYQKLSERMKDRYDIFGNIPDCIDDEWIDEIELFAEKAKTYLHLKEETTSIFERAASQAKFGPTNWEEWHRVLSRSDIDSVMERQW